MEPNRNPTNEEAEEPFDKASCLIIDMDNHENEACSGDIAQLKAQEEKEVLTMRDNNEGCTSINRNLEIYENQVISTKGQSTVFLGKFGAIEVAVKRIPENIYFLDKKYTQPEHVSLSELFQHPNVIRYFDYARKGGWIYLALERCDTDLDTLIDKWRRENSLPDQTVRANIASQICKGMHYLHQKGFVHRDMKPSNILLTWMGHGILSVKICDMSISRKLEHFTYSETGHSGSAGYMPFELLDAIHNARKAEHLSFSVDVFPLGVTFHVLLSPGKHPFGEFIFRDVNILRREKPDIDEASLSYEAQALVSDMVEHEANKRPSVQMVMEHPFFWTDYSKMDFLCKVSERIRSILNRDIGSTNFLDEFKDVVNAKLPGGQWSAQLPTRPSWGDNQKTPQQASSGHEGTTLGLIRFTRNMWTHRVQNVAKGHFASEGEICNILLGSFPWMVTEIYRLSEKHYALDLTIWLESVARH